MQTVLRTVIFTLKRLKTHNPIAHSLHRPANGLKVTSLSLVFSVGSNLAYISKPHTVESAYPARPDADSEGRAVVLRPCRVLAVT